MTVTGTRRPSSISSRRTSVPPPRRGGPVGPRRAPKVDPRIRARRDAIERARILRRRRVGVALAGVVTIAGIGFAVVLSPLLDVETITVTGAEHSGVEAVRRAADVQGDPLLLLSPGGVEHRVEQLPWVRRAHVERLLPSALRIDVRERVPVAWVPAAGAVAVVDRTGRVLASVAAPPAGLPELRGVVRVGRPGGRIVPAGPARLAGSLPPELRARTAQAEIDDRGASLTLVGGPHVRLGDPRDLSAKAKVAAAVLGAVGGAAIQYVDVSVPEAPVTG